MCEIIFKNDQEKYEYEKYAYLKGKEYYHYIARQLNNFNYSCVASAIRYDLRLRYDLYHYIGLVEDMLKARVIDNKLDDDYTLENFLEKNTKTSLNEINQIIIKTHANLEYETKENLEMIRELRNKIAHFTPLIFESKTEVEEKIKALALVIPQSHKQKFIQAIKNCQKNLDIPDKSILIKL
ncbi:hypothetical protein CXP39_02970 [Mesoplasma syrphidae]|uniref:Uncharacterized protein n=1 Tax=Mesoplasma syrphidae TaxID=225999 RepID=A0A2K9C630_9MOLU|nr:hypothetical protein [Mesoplasma syrphidae]AUF83747.1 hypothetical protein CXP39_02970 [Mesoplasma syrphidae]